MNALLAVTDFLTVLQLKEMLGEKDVSRFERVQNEVECAAWLEHFSPDIVVIDTDDSPVLPSWLIGLCLTRGTPVLALSSDPEADSSDPSVVILHKPYMKQQARVVIEETLARRGSHGGAVASSSMSKPQ